jgi:hypothetical protein
VESEGWRSNLLQNHEIIVIESYIVLAKSSMDTLCTISMFSKIQLDGIIPPQYYLEYFGNIDAIQAIAGLGKASS